ncbi:MAG: hydrogenase maturation nickel metallochaperone HypA [Nitrospinota bacterium]
MHEMSVAVDIIEIVEGQLKPGQDQNVTKVNLIIGELSGISVEALEFAFSVAIQNTNLKNSELNIESIKPVAYCNDCMSQFSPTYKIFLCPNCDTLNVSLIKGKEFEVNSIEVD